MDNRLTLHPKPAAVLAALAAIALVGAPPAHGCAVLNTDVGGKASVTSEAAVIVWDKETGTEHFIRRATMEGLSPSDAESMGFLVPTPTTPQIGTVDDNLFQTLNSTTGPARQAEYLNGFKAGWLLSYAFGGKSEEPQPSNTLYRGLDTSVPSSRSAAVQVEKQVRVGVYDATVLAARDTKALKEWLTAHDLKADSSVMAWLDLYVKKGWKITAFTIAKGQGELFELTPVRLSFKTDAPYYPYREPASARAAGNFSDKRTLSVYYVGAERAAGTLGRKTGAGWPGKTTWAAPLPAEAQVGLEDSGIPIAALANARMSVFADNSSPRPGTDEVFFASAKVQKDIKPAPIVETIDRRILLPLEMALMAFVAACMCLMKLANRLARRRGEQAAAA